MLLKIQTLSCPPPDTPQSIHAQFDAAGGRIGRSPPCKLILPDPNRHISREHAEIRFNGNAFSIKVVSKVNSVLVNNVVVSPGEAVDIKDGDQILIGEYLLRATVAAAAPAPSRMSTAPASSSSNPFDLFDSLNVGSSKTSGPAQPPPPDWFSAPAAPASPVAPRGAAGSLDEFFDAPPENSNFSELLKNSSPHVPASAPKPPPATPPDNRLDQFLGIGSSLDSDPLSDSLHSGAPDLYRTSALDLPLNSSSRPPPSSAPAPPSSVPFAFDDDIFKSLEQDFGSLAQMPAPAPVATPTPELFAFPSQAPIDTPASPAAEPVADELSFELPPTLPSAAPVAPTTPPPAPPPLVADTPAQTAVLPTPAVSGPDELERFSGLTPPAAGSPSPLSVAVAAPPALSPSSAAFAAALPVDVAGPDGQAARLMTVLAEALGLEESELDSSNPEQTIRLVGELLRMSTDGLFRMLDMRSQLKSELHIEDRTMIASRENNPLKHADSPRDAIAYLVDLRQHGNRLFMPPGKAVEDTIWDICAHEMAVMAGTRAALLAALKMFSPEVIEGRIKKSGALDNLLPALHKSRLWERFLGMYADLQHEAEDHFDRLLNQEFSKAYSEQSRKLKKKR